MKSLSNAEANVYHIKGECPALETIEKNTTRKGKQEETRKLETQNGNMEGESLPYWESKMKTKHD